MTISRRGHDALRRHEPHVQRHVERQADDVEPQRVALAVLGDQRVAEQPVDVRQRPRGQQQAQRGGGVVEPRAARERHDPRRQHHPAGRQRQPHRPEHVAGRLQQLLRALVLVDHVAREQREDRGHDDGREQRHQLVDPPGQRVEADLAVAARERDDHRVGAEVDLVERQRQPERQRRHQQRPPHLRLGDEANRRHVAHEVRRQRERDRRADGRARDDRVEAQVGHDHDNRGQQRRRPSHHVADHGTLHPQPRLEHERDRGDEDRHAHLLGVGKRERDGRRDQHDDERDQRPQGHRVADEAARVLRALGDLAHDDREQPHVGEHAEERDVGQGERVAPVRRRAEVARDDDDRDRGQREDRDLARGLHGGVHRHPPAEPAVVQRLFVRAQRAAAGA